MVAQRLELTRHDLEAKIVKHSWEDEAFRKEFIADPASAFVRYLEIPAEGLPKIAVHQEEPGSWHIVLPQAPTNARELSEEELERVAGGFTPIAPTISILATAAVGGSFLGSTITASAIVSVDKGW
jgi:hypothetical protein